MAGAHPISLVEPGVTYQSVTAEISAVPLRAPGRGWLLGFAATLLGVTAFVIAVTWLFYKGVGIWGNQSPVFWGLAIASYVWWISMAHAGTMISALLLLVNRGWRNSLNRFAEAMTVFAVVQAGLAPILHLGRPWLFYWLLPYPNTMTVWPQFRSPLEWDIFGVLTYLIFSVLFWYLGLLPDLATVRDRASGRFGQVAFGVGCLGWRNSAAHWQRWRTAYFIGAALAVPLVTMVESGVSMLFAGGIIPGWHTTIYPPYFLIEAVQEGFAVVILISITLRAAFNLRDVVTDRHLDMLAQLLLLFSLMTTYCYFFEAFDGWYSGDEFERQTLWDRAFVTYPWTYWSAMLFTVFVPNVLWFRRLRRKVPVLALVALMITAGVWLAHFTEVEASLARDYLPAAWQVYTPSAWEWLLLGGMIGLWFFLFFLFVRLLPMISMFELKEVLHADRQEA
jgi:Ni/Fe-hydrogenase subunit HybB-like protein